MKARSLLNYLAARMREPSTLAGLSVLGVLIGVPAGTVDTVAQVVSGIAILGAMAMSDPKAPAAPIGAIAPAPIAPSTWSTSTDAQSADLTNSAGG